MGLLLTTPTPHPPALSHLPALSHPPALRHPPALSHLPALSHHLPALSHPPALRAAVGHSTHKKRTMSSDDSDYVLSPTDEVQEALINGTAAEAASAVNAATAAAAAAAALPARLPPLFEILQDSEHFRRYESNSGTRRIECLWCNKDLPGNATKVLHHVCRSNGKGVAPCSGTIPPIHKERYFDLLHRKEGRKNSRAGELIFYTSINIISII